MKWRMTFRHLCLFKIIRPLILFVIVALREFTIFITISHSNLVVEYILCLNSFIVTKVIFIPTFLPSFILTLVCLHVSLFFLLSLSVFLTFLIDTKTARRVRQHSRRVVSFRLFRSRRGSVSLCALLIFLPLHRVRLCVYEYICVCSLHFVYVSY
jgi:hypothetical protein